MSWWGYGILVWLDVGALLWWGARANGLSEGKAFLIGLLWPVFLLAALI